MNNQQSTAQAQPTGANAQPASNPVAQYIEQSRNEWMTAISDMNASMTSLPKLNELINIIYTKRMEAVETYHKINDIILSRNKAYMATFTAMFNAIKLNGYNGMRFSSDQAIQRQLEVDLADQKEAVDLLKSHNDFMEETIETLDDMIYGIKYKIRVYELINGINQVR